MLKNIMNPVYVSEDKTMIHVQGTIGNENRGFVAHKDDVEEHGAEIYADCVAQKYGKVMPYVKHKVVPTVDSNDRPLSAKDGNMFFDKKLGRPVWFVEEKNGWVDYTGTLV
jgi:hypothetical protein